MTFPICECETCDCNERISFAEADANAGICTDCAEGDHVYDEDGDE
jgi:hypothetical protein